MAGVLAPRAPALSTTRRRSSRRRHVWPLLGQCSRVEAQLILVDRLPPGDFTFLHLKACRARYGGGHGTPMLLWAGTAPAAMTALARGRSRSMSSSAPSLPMLATMGAASLSVPS